MPDAVRLRFATADAAADLSLLSQWTYAAAFGRHFAPGDLEAHLERNLSTACWRQYLVRDRVLMAYDDEMPVGFVQFGPKPDSEGDLLIHRAYVRPDRLGQGIGTRMLAAVLDLEDVRAAPAVWIDVWEHNSGARRLYARLGFIETGRRGAPFVTASGKTSPGDLLLVRRRGGPPN